MGSYGPPLWGQSSYINYLKFFRWEICFFSRIYLFIQSYSNLWRRKWQPTPVYSCLKNFMGRGVRQAPVHGVTKSQLRLSTAYSNISMDLYVYLFSDLNSVLCYFIAWTVPVLPTEISFSWLPCSLTCPRCFALWTPITFSFLIGKDRHLYFWMAYIWNHWETRLNLLILSKYWVLVSLSS